MLEPARTRTLRELFEFVAQKAMRPSIEPVNIMGSTCFTAGAFLTIRSLLRDSGADVYSVAPSTPLDQYARRYLWVFLGSVSRLAENTIPVKLSTP